MFAIEIGFNDGGSVPESMLVRRPVVTIGASEASNIVIEDLSRCPFQIQLIRGVGQKFEIRKIKIPGQNLEEDRFEIEGAHSGSATLNLGAIRLQVTALDVDLQPRESEPADKAGIRLLRLAVEKTSPDYPAVQIEGVETPIVSFHPGSSILAGRSNRCSARVDELDVSNKHARIGFEDGQFWVEDLGSTNGTFVNNQQISGRLSIPSGARIQLGRSTSLRCLNSSVDSGLESDRPGKISENTTHVQFPALISLSDLVRPARIVFQVGQKLILGRDPSCDMWVGAPHISRQHCVISFTSPETMDVIDTSTNGTRVNGEIIKNSEVRGVSISGTVIDLGEGVVLGACATAEQEQGLITWYSVGMPMGRAGDGHEVIGNTKNSISDGRERRLTVQIVGRGIAQRIKHPLGIFRSFADMFKRADPIGRLLFMVFCLLLVLVVAVVFTLLLPVFFR